MTISHEYRVGGGEEGGPSGDPVQGSEPGLAGSDGEGVSEGKRSSSLYLNRRGKRIPYIIKNARALEDFTNSNFITHRDPVLP